MTTKLRSTDVEFPDGSTQSTARNQPIYVGDSNYNNVINSYRNFPVGTTVSFFLGNVRRSGNFRDRYQVVYQKTGSNSWSEVGG